MSSGPVLRAEGVAKGFTQGEHRIDVLSGVDLHVQPGELVALLGRSGSGKSTLLHLLAGLEQADAGEIWVAGKNIGAAGEEARAQIRNDHLGFVYQMHHLLAEFTAAENVAMPLRIAGYRRRDALAQADKLLAAVGLSERALHRPAELSGGERQRTAVARALANSPQVVLADEPTGNLDRASAEQVLDLMLTLGRSQGVGFLIATHDANIAERVDRVVTLSGGQLA